MLHRDRRRGGLDQVWVVVHEPLGLRQARAEVARERTEHERPPARLRAERGEVARHRRQRYPAVLLECVLSVGVGVEDQHLVGVPSPGISPTRLSLGVPGATSALSVSRVLGVPAAAVRRRAPVSRSTYRAGIEKIGWA